MPNPPRLNLPERTHGLISATRKFLTEANHSRHEGPHTALSSLGQPTRATDPDACKWCLIGALTYVNTNQPFALEVIREAMLRVRAAMPRKYATIAEMNSKQELHRTKQVLELVERRLEEELAE